MPESPAIRHERLRIAGETGRRPDAASTCAIPYTSEVVGTVPKATVDDVRRAIRQATAFQAKLTRYERYQILMHAARRSSPTRRDEIARLITLESRHVHEGHDCTRSAAPTTCCCSPANQALVDDGQVFSCDLTPHGKARKVYTLREPLLGVDLGDHALQPPAEPGRPQGRAGDRHQQPRGAEAHRKDAADGAALADVLYEAGLPPPMLSVVTGDPREIADEMLTNAGRRSGHLHRRRGHRQVHRRQGRSTSARCSNSAATIR